MIHHNSDLFYDIYTTVIEYNQRYNQYPLFLFPTQLDISEEAIKNIFNNFISFIINQISMSSLFEYTICSLSESSEETKLIATVN